MACAPFDPVTGSFSVTFDNANYITDSSSLFATISLPLTGGILFSYDAGLDLFVLGGALNGADSAITGTDDFLFILGGVSTGTPTFTSSDFVHTRAGAPGIGFFPQNITLTAVPDEASTLGFAGDGVRGSGVTRPASAAGLCLTPGRTADRTTPENCSRG